MTLTANMIPEALEKRREKRRKRKSEQKIKKYMHNDGISHKKNLFNAFDLTPFNANKLTDGENVEDIILGDNHIYNSVFELGNRLSGSFGVKKGANQ